MLFTWISVAAALVPLAAASVLHAALEARVTVNPQTCVGYEKYIGIHDNTLSYSPACASIVCVSPSAHAHGFIELNRRPRRVSKRTVPASGATSPASQRLLARAYVIYSIFPFPAEFRVRQ
jgi:hypothetical protein